LPFRTGLPAFAGGQAFLSIAERAGRCTGLSAGKLFF